MLNLCDTLEKSGFDAPKELWDDSWDVGLLYNGKAYEMNYWTMEGTEALRMLIDEIIRLSPLAVDLHGWA